MVHVHTMGCKANTADSEAIRQMLQDFDQPLHVLNTCSVTDAADKEAERIIRKLKKQDPEALIVVTGCGAETRLWDHHNVCVVGNHEKQDLRASIVAYIQGERKNHHVLAERVSHHTKNLIGHSSPSTLRQKRDFS